ncbi:MAG: AraC family transcriptional regulator [Ferruginibacter sp.]
MNLYIKNMVCDRCIMVVRQQLDEQGLAYKNIQLGQVELVEETTPAKLDAFRETLLNTGFELLDDKKAMLVEQIKNTIISLVQGYGEDDFNKKLSAILEEKLQLDYHYFTTLFSSVEGITIEKYAILQRIEKVKELLMYDELSLSEISYQLGYSSVQHLSQQFKKITGLTPSQFKQLKENNRKPLDKI